MIAFKSLIPQVIAETVVGRPYDGTEMSNQSQSNIDRIESWRKNMTPEQRLSFINYAVQYCIDANKVKAKWFLQCVNSKTNRGRDKLYVWIQHWLAGFLTKLNA